MTDVVFAGHTGAPAGWAHGEIYRVLHKLLELGQITHLHVALDRGSAFAATEAALLAQIPVVWHPLWPVAELSERLQSYPGLGPRADALRQHRLLDIADHGLTGTSRAARRRRSSILAALSEHHVVLYDGRDRGSVLDHLQTVMGTHDLIIIDPSDETTRRMPPYPTGAPCPTTTSPSSSPASST